MVELKVTGMSCDHCVRAVTRALSAVPGVTRVVKVSLEEGVAVVEGSADREDLVAAVVEEGYGVEAAE